MSRATDAENGILSDRNPPPPYSRRPSRESRPGPDAHERTPLLPKPDENNAASEVPWYALQTAVPLWKALVIAGLLILLVWLPRLDNRGDLHWGAVTAGKCASRGVHEHTARLWGASGDWLVACEKALRDLNGSAAQTPTRCETRGWLRGVVGVWRVDGEAYCTPQWSPAQQGNCVSRHQREWRASQDNVHYDPLRACLDDPYVRGPNDPPGSPQCVTTSDRQVVASWTVKDALCVSEWGAMQQRNCVAYSTRRWEAVLQNVTYDARRACADTPVTLPNGLTIDAPTNCVSNRRGEMVGQWDVRDAADLACTPWWDEPRPVRCAQCGIREYTARLSNVNYDPMRACGDTPIVIRDTVHSAPYSCQKDGGVMVGTWRVDHDTWCMPHWGHTDRKGCMEKGLLRFMAPIQDVRDADWRVMCETTPKEVLGVHYNGAHYCIDRGWWIGRFKGGRHWGIWDVQVSAEICP